MDIFIRATVGDTLLFSQLGSVDLIKILTRIDFATSPLEIKMKEQINVLSEVTIQNTSEINAVSLGIIPKKLKF